MQLVVEDLEEKYLPKKGNKQLETLKDQIKRCKDALSVLSASVGSAPLEKGEPMRLYHFVTELLEDWKTSRPEINIETTWKGDSSGPEILAERSLKQAIKNVLDNAANVSPEYVCCNAILGPEALTLLVIDHGPGIHLDEAETIGQQPSKEKSKGLGLGLFLSHSIIKRFGGKVSLKNRAEGGLQTTISLPLKELVI
jgi:two-component system sensor histidine kinase RegB